MAGKVIVRGRAAGLAAALLFGTSLSALSGDESGNGSAGSLISGAARQTLRHSPREQPGRSRVRLTDHESDEDVAPDAKPLVLQRASPAESTNGADDQPPLPNRTEAPIASLPAEHGFPIDLATTWRLAGANHLQIALAQERIQEALARQQGAEALWIPSFSAGIAYNAHTGRIQDTEGEIIDTNRDSLFAGGGLGLGNTPLNGPAGGPRLFVDLSPLDVYFEPLSARQITRAAQADHSTVFNDALLQVTLAYLELVQSQSDLAIAHEAVRNAEELARITADHARAGTGLVADAQRARAELSARRRLRSAAVERTRVVSAELARLLRLDPQVALFAMDARPMPMEVVDTRFPARDLIAQALAARPELARQSWIASAADQRVRQETLRPLVPNLHLGVSSGAFGGGAGGEFADFSDRTDFDALLVWELENLGLGNRARRREQQSLQRQARLEYAWLRDQVAADVVRAHAQVEQRMEQLIEAEAQVQAAADALPLNFQGILAGELRAIEAQQAIAALATARGDHVAAVTAYNRAQFALLRAIGQPPGLTGAQQKTPR